VNRPALMVLLAVLELVALAYFVFMVWRADGLAEVLLRRGYEQRGWTRERLAARLRVLGIVGILVALGAIGVAVVKMVGA
jgi:hypothetical protein